ncbi:MAG TPA: PhnD/SsuA/transferrin family substrate-binding protein [bacterium]|nr:PhnD/SsuA/transferrin family substrate-binding protein [bacterium]
MNRYLNPKILALLIFVSVVLFSGSAHGEQQAADGGREPLVFFLPSKATAVFKQVEMMCDMIGEKIGVPVVLKTAEDIPIENPTTEQLFEWAKKEAEMGNIDITVVPPTGLYMLIDAGIKMIPIATYQIDKKKTDRACLYVKKGHPAKELKTDAERIEAFRGKKVGIGHGMKSNPVAEMLLIDMGIDTPSYEYFENVGDEYGSIEDKINQIMDGTIDGVITFKVDLKFAFYKNQELAGSIEPLVCGQEYTNIPFVIRDGLDVEIAKRFRKVLLNIHKDKDFSQLHFVFYTINGHIVAVSSKDYENWERVYRKGRREGWLDAIGQWQLPGDGS